MAELATFQARRLAAEYALIAAAVYGDHAAELLAAQEPQDLSAGTRDLWQRCRELHRENGRLDELVLSVAPGVSQEAINAVLKMGGVVGDAQQHLGEVRCATALDEALRLSQAAIRKLSNADLRMAEVSTAITEFSGHLLRVAGRLGFVEEGRDLAAAGEKFLLALQEPETTWTLSTGVDDLDQRTGGLRPGTLMVVIGRSGHGKSSMALTASLLAAQAGSRVCYVTREMLREEMAGRFAAAALNEPLNRLRRDLIAGDESAYTLVRERLKLPVDIVDEVRHIDAIAALVEREMMGGSPYRLLVLDFLQVLEAEGREQHERLERIAYVAKDISLRCQCAVLLLAQPNRAGSKNEGLPSMHDIRGSSAVENAADNIVAVLRDKPTLATGDDYPFEMRVEKARNGRPGDMEGEYRLGAGTFLISQDKSENKTVVSEESLRS